MKGYYLSHVFGGLMCFVNEPRAKIYNTTTRQLVVLPDIEESNMIAENHKHKKIMYHIGHDPVHDQYKVVCIVSRPSDEYGEDSYLSEHWILLLGGDRSNRWRKIPSRCQPHVPVTQVLNISGRMHYLAWVRFLCSVLVSFDINSEEISILELPKENDFLPKMTDLIEYGGRVALLHHIDLRRQGVLNLWVVEDSKKNMWSSKTLVLHPSQMHLVNSIGLKVQGITRNGEVVLERRMKSHQRLPEIPLELVTEILTRLPAKSLMRFKSVSKHWLYLICSRNFTNLCLRVSSSPPRLYMSLSFFDNSHLKKILLSSSPSCDSDGTTMSSFDGDQDLTIPAMRGYASNVFRGLMCFINGPSAQIYNTTTRQLVVLPNIEESSIIAEDDHKIEEIMCFMGHDPVPDQYKVVCIASRRSGEVGEYSFLSEHWVFLLEGDGSTRWKKISCGSPPHLPLTQALNINGRMHYLAVVSMDFVLVIFDIHSEEISVLQVPKDIFWPDAGLIEYCGNIALLNYPNLEKEGLIELWVLEDEEKNMWGSKTLVLHPSQMRMVNSIRLRVQGTTRNGEVILAPRDRILFNIFLYDLQKNHMRKIEIKGTPNRHLTKFCEVVGMDDVENLIYL